MSEENKTLIWWQTLPGVLSALAALITASAGLLVVLNEPDEPPPSQSGSTVMTAETAKPTAGANFGEMAGINPAQPIEIAAPLAGLPFYLQRYVTEGDLVGKSNWQLDLMRNEIFARHGRTFQRQELQDYFAAQPWYRPTYTPDNFPAHTLSVIENSNVLFIQQYQKQHFGGH